MTDEIRDDNPNNDVLLAGPEDAPPIWKFTLVMAEVIFSCDLGIQTRRIQFVSKSDGEIFPRSRLVQLQQLAASNVVADIRRESNGAIKVSGVEAVYLLGTIDMGWMTEEDFLGADTTLVSAGEIQTGDNASLPVPDNVVQMRPPVDDHTG